MTNITYFKSKFDLIPRSVKFFLLKAVMFYLVWNAAYHLYLQPNHIIDPVLTLIVGKFTTTVVQLLFPRHLVAMHILLGTPNIFIDGLSNLTILDGCNGLELFVFYTGFIFCFPGTTKLALKFIIWGSISIFALNVARCAALSCFSYYRFTYIETFHHYIFTVVVYGFIVFLWFIYLKSTLKPAGKAIL